MPINGDKHRFTRKNVELVPEEPGVYALFDDGDVTFYGRAEGGSDTIRARLGDHLAGRQAPGRVKVKLFSFEVTRYPLSRERALLEEHKRDNWRLPEFNAAARPPRALGNGTIVPDPRRRGALAGVAGAPRAG
jgi:excinuclease UvrABC nuclease subunit